MDKETLDYWVDDADEIGHLIPEIPSLLAKSAIAPYLPSWTERERVFYYDRLNYSLREAQVYVNEGNWEGAAHEWLTLTESKLRRYRLMAHYNLALYYEMTDDISQALASLDKAEREASPKGGQESPTLSLIKQYREVLQNRQKELYELNIYK